HRQQRQHREGERRADDGRHEAVERLPAALDRARPPVDHGGVADRGGDAAQRRVHPGQQQRDGGRGEGGQRQRRGPAGQRAVVGGGGGQRGCRGPGAGGFGVFGVCGGG